MKKTNCISLLVVDDHPTIRHGIKQCLSHYEGIHVIGEASSGFEAMDQAIQLTPDIILMDVSMPGMNGIDTTELILKKQPDSKILMFSMHEDIEFLSNSIGMGAKGYVLKNASPDEIYYAIHSVNSGGSHFSGNILHKMLRPSPPSVTDRLTTREQKILAYIAEGLSSKHIARKLSLSVRTVEAHRRNIKTKLECNSVADMVKYAIEHKVVTYN